MQALNAPSGAALKESLANGGGVLAKVQDDSSVIGTFPDVLAHPFKVGFSDSMSLVLLYGGIVMLLAFLILLLLPPVELRATSASAAARAEDGEPRAPGRSRRPTPPRPGLGQPGRCRVGRRRRGRPPRARRDGRGRGPRRGPESGGGRHVAGVRHAGPAQPEE